jgi:hypothetical protein
MDVERTLFRPSVAGLLLCFLNLEDRQVYYY